MLTAAFLLLAVQATPSAPAAAAPGPSRATREHANLASYFSADDYPVPAWTAGEEGSVRFQISIGADGRVDDCDVTQTSGSAALDRRTCEILIARARYAPARNEQGLPIRASDYGTVIWRLPVQEVSPFNIPTPAQPPHADLVPFFGVADYPAEARRARVEGSVGYSALVGEDGRVRGCVVTRSSGSAALDAATCAIFFIRVHYRPARDAQGRAIAGTVDGRVNWRLPVDP